MSSQSPLFRQQALEFYAQRREKTVLPRLIRPPVLLLLWLLLALAAVAVVVSWLTRVPVFVSGPGMVGEGSPMAHTATALIFLPVTPGHHLVVEVGTSAHIQLAGGVQVTGKVALVVAETFSPQEIARRYHFAVQGPSMIVMVPLAGFTAPIYTGSVVQAQIQTGTTSILSSLFSTMQAGGA